MWCVCCVNKRSEKLRSNNRYLPYYFWRSVTSLYKHRHKWWYFTDTRFMHCNSVRKDRSSSLHAVANFRVSVCEGSERTCALACVDMRECTYTRRNFCVHFQGIRPSASSFHLVPRLLAYPLARNFRLTLQIMKGSPTEVTVWIREKFPWTYESKVSPNDRKLLKLNLRLFVEKYHWFESLIIYQLCATYANVAFICFLLMSFTN